MSNRVLIKPQNLGLRRRMGTRALPYPWPFLMSVEPGRGLVRNVLVEPPSPPTSGELPGAPEGEAPKNANFDARKRRVFISIR